MLCSTSVDVMVCAFALLCVRCCIGTGSCESGMARCDVLWLFLLFLPTVSGVCTSCFGDEPTCAGDASTCPWRTVVASNVAAVAGATGALIALEKVLPNKFVRLFSRSVLHTLSTIAAKPKAGTTFDFDGKTGNQIFSAVKGNYITQDEAITELMYKISVEERKTDSQRDDLKVKDWERAITVIQKSDLKFAHTDVSEGVYLFVLAKLSTVICGDVAGSFDLCVEIADEAPSTSSGGSKRFGASLKRPKSFAQMCSLIHQFQMVCVAAGLCSIMAIAPFLDEVIFEPTRLSSLEWPVAFELMIGYLRMIENEPSRWRISNVVHASGGMDAKRAEATAMAKGLYPKMCFRTHGGIPGNVDDDNKEDKRSKNKEAFKGTVIGFNENSKKGCAAWNNGTPHLAKHVDPTGRCLFFHGCNQYVTDKGAAGQCLAADHKRSGCTYDAAKKCKEAFKP